MNSRNEFVGQYVIPAPDWSLCPWASWATLIIETNGPIVFKWQFYEHKPEQDKNRRGHYYTTEGKRRTDERNPVPLAHVIDLESSLVHRPIGAYAEWRGG